jgi:hypothetical protein
MTAMETHLYNENLKRTGSEILGEGITIDPVAE